MSIVPIDNTLPVTAPRGSGQRVIQGGRPRTQELLRQFSRTMYDEAYRQSMSLSAWLEREDPSTPDELREGMDSFNRMLRLADIRTASVPEYGVYAHSFGEFERDPGTYAMVPEFVARTWRRAATGQPMHRVVHATPDIALGSGLNPWNDVSRPRQEITPAIPLSALVGATTAIDSDAYRAFYLLSEPASEFRLVRVAESAEIPRARLLAGQYTIRLHKYGRALEATYETLRRMPIDKVAFYIRRLAVQAEVDKVLAVLDTMINGDGNANTAAEVLDLTDLDPATTANNLTLRGWLAFRMAFQNPFIMQTALARTNVALGLMLLNTGSANIPLVMLPGNTFGGFAAVNRNQLGDATSLGWLAEAPANQIVGFDQRFAVERITETGSQLSEVDRWVTRQTQILTFTEVEGYAVIDPNATKVLNLAA